MSGKQRAQQDSANHEAAHASADLVEQAAGSQPYDCPDQEDANEAGRQPAKPQKHLPRLSFDVAADNTPEGSKEGSSHAADDWGDFVS